MIFGLDPLVFGILMGLIAGAGIELLIVLGPGRYFIAKKTRRETLDSLNKGEWDPALDRALKPLKAHVTGEVAAFEARFSEAYSQDMTAIDEKMEKIPSRISGMIHASAGNEEKAFRAMVVDAEAEVEGEISLMEASVAQDPRAMQIAIAQKIQKLGTDPEWQEKHQIGAVLLEIAKPQLMGWVQTAAAQMQGIPLSPQLGPGRRGNTTNPYGL